MEIPVVEPLVDFNNNCFDRLLIDPNKYAVKQKKV